MKSTKDPQERVAQKAAKKAKKEAVKAQKKAFHKPLKETLRSPKFRHGTAANVFTVGLLAVLVLLNVFASILVQKYPSLNLDMTTGGLNSLSDTTKNVVKNVSQETDIYILASEAQVKGDEILSNYGIKYSQVANLCAKMTEMNPNIKISYKDLDTDPSFASGYSSEKLSAGDIIIKTPSRYRHIAYTDLFNINSDSTGSTAIYSLVDSTLASAINNVNANTLPIVAFDTGHQEQLDTTAMEKILSGSNFETKSFSLLTDAIPDNTQLIVLATPSNDLTTDEVEKLESYLKDSSQAADRGLAVTFYPNQSAMPNLTALLKEWGIQPQRNYVAESNSQKYLSQDPTYLLAQAQSSVTLNSNHSYNLLIAPASVPFNLLFSEQNGIKTYSLMKTSSTCYALSMDQKATGEEKNNQQAFDIAVLAQSTVSSNGNDYHANVVALGSSPFFVDGIVNSSTFNNSTWTADLARYMTGSNDSGTIPTKSVQTNTMDISIPTGAINLLGIGIFTLLIPMCFAVAGIVVYRKRRRL